MTRRREHEFVVSRLLMITQFNNALPFLSFPPTYTLLNELALIPPPPLNTKLHRRSAPVLRFDEAVAVELGECDAAREVERRP